MKIIVASSLLAVLVNLFHSAGAQDGVTVQAPSITLEAKVNVAVRSSPPSGWFYLKGAEVGVITKGEKVIATDQKVVRTLYGDFQWLKVQKLGLKTNQPILSGWVYTGGKEAPHYFDKLEIAPPLKTPPPRGLEQSAGDGKEDRRTEKPSSSTGGDK